MLTSQFIETYAGPHHPIDPTSPELAFLERLCTPGSNNAAALFNEMTLYGAQACVDVPQGRFAGIAAIDRFARHWLADFGAESATVHPCIQTIANGRAASEVEIHFRAADGSIRRVPMAVFGDLAPYGRLEGLRIYFFYQWMPGASAYRKPIYPASDMAPMPYPLLTGVVRHYYEQLHNPDSAEALARIVGMASDDVQYGGYRPQEVEPIFFGKPDFRRVYEGITNSVPRAAYVRFETIVDDGVNCVVEWTAVMQLASALKGEHSQAGMAAYERGADGSLQSVRICDNAGMEADIEPGVPSFADDYIDLRRADRPNRAEPWIGK